MSKKTWKVYFVEASANMEFYVSPEGDIIGNGEFSRVVKSAREFLREYLSDEKAKVLMYVLNIDPNQALYLDDMKQLIEFLRTAKIYSENLTEQEVLSRMMRKHFGITIEDFKKMITELFQ